MDPKLYPGAAHAVELCERLKFWKMYRETAEVEGVPALKQYMRRDAEFAARWMDSESASREVIRLAIAEWEHPDFDLYLAAKLGAV